MTNVQFEYKVLPLRKLRVQERTTNDTSRIQPLLVDGEPIVPTNRFWNSLFSRFGFNRAFFRYFSYEEVFDRISQQNDDQLRFCIERSKNGSHLLAVSNPKHTIITNDVINDIIHDTNPTRTTYAYGLVETYHRSPNNVSITIGPDVFTNQYVFTCPIDGYGVTSVYLSLLRMICTNGVVTYSPAFRTVVPIGRRAENLKPAITRVLDNYNNDEGYAAIRQRIQSSQSSWASINETLRLQKILYNLHTSGQIINQTAATNTMISQLIDVHNYGEKQYVPRTKQAVVDAPLVRAFNRLTGDYSYIYGLTNINALSNKRRTTMPVRCTVYDLLNFATEVASHHADTAGARLLNAWVGDMVSHEYDLEGLGKKFGEFDDFYIDDASNN